MGSSAYGEDVRRPTGWLTLAFLGVSLYLVSALLQIYRFPVANALRVNVSDLGDLLGVTSWLGQILFFAGLVAALWRANLAAGLSGASVTGLTLGAAGIGILGLFELALLMNLLAIEIVPVVSLVQARDMVTLVGTFLGFAGLAALAVGLTQAAGLFAHMKTPELPAAAPVSGDKPV